jgi:hypothetical protein
MRLIKLKARKDTSKLPIVLVSTKPIQSQRSISKLGVFLALTLSLTFLVAPEAKAQRFPAQSTKAPGPRKQLATIVFSGLGGAVLGLSTLSFYSRPQEKLSNIGIGAAVGIIVGTVYTTYQAATRPYGALEIEREFNEMDSYNRLLVAEAPQISWTQAWEF